MSAAGRLSLELIFGSPEYTAWAAVPGHKTDANKIALEFKGQHRPPPGSQYAKGIVGLCRENPPLVPPPTPPAPGTVPAPFDGRGMVLLEPTGGVEDMDAVKNAGFTYVLLNLAFVRGGNWDTVRSRCAARGIEVVPWRRVSGTEDSAQIENTADRWESKATAHNLETEAATTYPPVNLASYVQQHWAARSRAVITEPWAQNNAGWGALAGWVGMPESFLNADTRYDPVSLTAHLQAEGIPRCVPLFGWGAWSDAPIYVTPAEYLAKWPGKPYGVYFGDSREPQYGEWRR